MPAIVAYTQRERTRALIRNAFPRRRTRLLLARSLQEFETALKTNLIDAAIVDVGAAQEETWRVAGMARDSSRARFFRREPPRYARSATHATSLLMKCDD